MNTEMNYLLEILEQSVEKNGVIPLTNNHLLNMIKLLYERQEEDENKINAIEFDPNW